MILALDLGLRRIGVARSFSGLLAEPLITIELKHGQLGTAAGQTEAVSRLKEIIGKEPLSALVIGLPKLADGQLSPFAEELKTYAQVIANALDITPRYEDETFTTAAAGSDHAAAALILEQYLTANQPPEQS